MLVGGRGLVMLIFVCYAKDMGYVFFQSGSRTAASKGAMPLRRRILSYVLFLAACIAAIPCLYVTGLLLSEDGFSLLDTLDNVALALAYLGWPAGLLFVLAILVRR